jgi:hypothetical protein
MLIISSVWLIVSVIILILFVSSLWFLISEHLKKFRFLGEHIRQSNNTITWQSPAVTSGMYQVMLTNIPDHITTILIGFDITIPFIGSSGVDPFGQISVQDGTIVFACYLGREVVTFRFLTNAPIEEGKVYIKCTPEDPSALETIRFLPHWWQRL